MAIIAETEEAKRRLAICVKCPFVKLTAGLFDRCTKCGCVCQMKARLHNGQCPEGKWNDNKKRA